MLTRKNRLWTLMAVAATITAGLTSCLKKSDNSPANLYSRVVFVNGAVNPVSIDVYDNSKKINSQVFEHGKYAPADFTPGTHEFAFKKFGTDSLLNDDLSNYDTLAWHTLVLYNNNIAGIDSSFQIFRIKEDYSNLSTQQVNVRLLHISPDAGNVDVYANGTKVISSRSYTDFKGNASFTPIPTGSTKFVVKRSSDNAPLDSLTLNELSPGQVYSLYLSGLKNTTDTKLKLALRPYWHTPY